MIGKKRENLINYTLSAMQEYDLAIKNIEKKDYARYSENCSNQARKASESLCKCIIIQSDLSDDEKEQLNKNDLNNLIQQVSKNKQPFILDSYLRQRVGNRLNILRTTGNDGSHENDYKITNDDLNEIKSSLLYLLKWYYNEHSEIEIPKELVYLFETENSFEFTMLDNILSSKFSKSENLYEEKRYKLKYELWKVHLMLDMYILFLDKDINITKTVNDFFKRLTFSIDFLTIITPHSINEKRIENIKKVFNDYKESNFEKIKDINVVSLSDFIWDNFSSNNKDIKEVYEEKYFMDQHLFELDKDYEVVKNELSIKYLLENSIEKEFAKPITLILGQGGVGKSTLTETLVNKINKRYTSKRAILIKAEILKNALKDSIDNISLTIDSIFDLYNLYLKYIDTDVMNFELNNKNIFNLSILSGNIILIIDGLDEIAGLLKEKFNLNNFVKSLVDLNKQLGECRIISTARDSYWNKEKDTINQIYVDVKYLFGFDDENVNKYLEKRFGKDVKEKYIQKVNILLKDIIDKRTKQYLPFYVNLISGVIETNDDINSLKINHSIKEYYHNEEVLDFLIYSILNREIVRHSFSINVSSFIEIFLELVANHGSTINKEDINGILNLYFNDENITDKFMLNPLLQEQNGIIKFRYDFLYNYFIVLYFIKSLKTHQIDNDFIKIFCHLYDGNNLLFEDTVKFFKKNDSFKDLKISHEKLIKKYKEENTKPMKLKLEKSISALLYLIQKVAGNNLSQDKRISYIIDLYTKEIRYFFIWGKFYPINLSGIHIYNSKFINYNNLCNSTIDESTRFYYSDISLSDDVETCININKNIFDSTCTLNTKINEILKTFDNNENAKEEIIKTELKRVFNHFFGNGYFENRKKDGCSNFGKKIYMKDNLITFLLKENVLCDYDPRRYSITEYFEPIVSDFIKNNNDVKLRNLIDKLMDICKVTTKSKKECDEPL
ncbi:NACHT domain-containing protein [Aliarcobacter cryaerophilus]|uniref:NACHT domain-containing protein n=1 Tax=Aliarcobacter cryaerophilus TaxID=28198 RepID=A0A5C0E5A4_9BACT|nr:ATP-binding protein [Aliarcobacter cryaerophilus]QEI46251.1 hypothetical protein pM830MA_0062 [Aliarcobacter cryaerophilus]